MATDGSDRTFGAPRFDVVLRGYDRRQVDEHISRLHRVLSRIRGDLEAARMQAAGTLPHTGQGGRPRPTPRPRPDGSGPPDVVGSFTDRMQSILQAAEEEAAEIRARAKADAKAAEDHAASSRAAARTDEDSARTTLADLIRQRDAVLADLKRLRGQLESLLASPTARPIPAAPEGPRTTERRDPGTGPSRVGPPTGPERGVRDARQDRPTSGPPGKPGSPGTPGAGTPAKSGNPGTPGTGTPTKPGNPGTPGTGTPAKSGNPGTPGTGTRAKPGNPGTPGAGTPAKPGLSPSVDLFQKPSDQRRREVQPQPPDKTATPTSTGERTVVAGREPGPPIGPSGATRKQPDEARSASPAETTVKVDAARAGEGRDAAGAATVDAGGDAAKPETVKSASPSRSQ